MINKGFKEISKKYGIKYSTICGWHARYGCETEEDFVKIIKDRESKVPHIGDRFNHFTVISEETKLQYRQKHVLVRCDCGNEVWRAWGDVRNGRRKSCGECKGLYQRIPINIGEKYGKWIVIEGPIEGQQKCHITYKCQCECGNIGYVNSTDLTTGKSTQCHKCGLKQSKETRLDNNGRIGDLTLTKFTRLKGNVRRGPNRTLEFNLSMQYLWNLYEAQGRKCALTGDDLPDINKASLDRINSKEGYIEGNVQWTTAESNIAKQQMTDEEFITLCKKVVNHANQQPSLSLTTEGGSETNS